MGRAFPFETSTPGPEFQFITHFKAGRGYDISFFTVSIGQKSDSSRAIRIIFQRDNSGGYAVLVPFEIYYPVASLVTATFSETGNPSIRVAS